MSPLSPPANLDTKSPATSTSSTSPSPSSPEPSSANLKTPQAQQDFPRSQLHPNPLISHPNTKMSTNRLPSPSQVDVEAASTIDLTMQLAREKVLARLERLQTRISSLPTLPPLTEEEQDLEERIERCTEMTDSLLAEAQAYLHDTSAREIARAETRRKRLSSGMLLARLTAFEAKVDAEMSASRTMQLLAQQEERSFNAAEGQSWHDWG